MTQQATVGFLYDDIPYVKIGEGPPLLIVAGLTPEYDVPKGWSAACPSATPRCWRATSPSMP